MKTSTLLRFFLLSLLLSGCGPVIGQVMRVADGLKEFEVTQGTIEDLAGGGELLVYGPFAKTSEAFYICRGEDAAHFAEELVKAGLFQSSLRLDREELDPSRAAALLKTLGAEELRQKFGLEKAPEKVLLGTILYRRTIVAPTRGVVMDVGYRLEFYDPRSRQSTVIEVAVRDLAERTVPRLVEELTRRLRHG